MYRAAARVVADLLPTTKKTVYSEVREAAVVVRRAGKVLLRQCGPDERWAGLWDFPRVGVDSEGPLLATTEIETKLRHLIGVRVVIGPHLKTFKHGVTRYRITLDCYEARYHSGGLKSLKTAPVQWVAPTKLGDFPLSTTGRKIAELLSGRASITD